MVIFCCLRHQLKIPSAKMGLFKCQEYCTALTINLYPSTLAIHTSEKLRVSSTTCPEAGQVKFSLVQAMVSTPDHWLTSNASLPYRNQDRYDIQPRYGGTDLMRQRFINLVRKTAHQATLRYLIQLELRRFCNENVIT